MMVNEALRKLSALDQEREDLLATLESIAATTSDVATMAAARAAIAKAKGAPCTTTP